MFRLFLMVFVAGMLAIAPTASADVPNCDCLDDWDVTWPTTPDNCLFVCPGAWGLPGHTPGSIADNKICLYKDDLCTDPLVGYNALRIDLSSILADSICACPSAAFPYIFPFTVTNALGCTNFRWQGSILQLENTEPVDVAWLQVSGCQDRPVRFRSPDVDANCDVGLADFVIFGASFVICPPQPLGASYQHYTVYTGHCAPCEQPALADFVVFAQHFGHICP